MRYDGASMRRPRGVTEKDVGRLRDIVQVIEHIDVGRKPALKLIADPLRELLGATYAGGYGFAYADGGMRCAFVHSQLPRTIVSALNASIASGRFDHWTRYNPFCPAPNERNKVKLFSPEAVAHTGVQRVLDRHGITNHHLRVLVCDGPSLLAWVGGFVDEPSGARGRWFLEQLVEPLRNRLLIERNLEIADHARATIDLAIEHVAGAAFIVGAGGRVMYANSAGRTRLASEGSAYARRLAEAVRRPDPELTAHAASGEGTRVFLVLARSDMDETRARASTAALRWRLTDRQREVLGEIVKGYTIERISAELGISPRTVEVHVTAILNKAQCHTRAELISAVLLASS